MAERLTRNNKVNYYFHDEASNMVYYKLQYLEDIMEKYGIEDLEQYVEEKRKQDKELRDNIQKLHTIINSTGYDRDTWKRACELACRHIAEVEWLSCPETDDKSESENEIKTLTKQSLNYFYQQAKKEGNDERN